MYNVPYLPSSHGAPATVAQLGKYCTEAGGKSRLAGLPLERGKRKTNNHFWKKIASHAFTCGLGDKERFD